MCACVGWCVRLPEGICLPLSPLVSHCLPLSPTVSRRYATCVPVLDAVSAFLRVFLASPCLPLSPYMCARVGWCVPSRGSCLSLSPLVSPCLPCACVGWCVRLPEGLVSPCLPLSPCIPSCFPLLDGVSAFPRVLSPLVSPCLSLSPLVSPCLPLSPLVPMLGSLCLPFVAGGVILHLSLMPWSHWVCSCSPAWKLWLLGRFSLAYLSLCPTRPGPKHAWADKASCPFHFGSDNIWPNVDKRFTSCTHEDSALLHQFAQREDCAVDGMDGMLRSYYGLVPSRCDTNNIRRKFRSQTSDNMDRWKAEQGRGRGRGREKRKIRREKSRRERVRRKKMEMREKVGKSRFTVFFPRAPAKGSS